MVIVLCIVVYILNKNLIRTQIRHKEDKELKKNLLGRAHIQDQKAKYQLVSEKHITFSPERVH